MTVTVSATGDCSLDLSLGPQNGGEPGSLRQAQVITTLESANINTSITYANCPTYPNCQDSSEAGQRHEGGGGSRPGGCQPQHEGI